MATIMQSQSQQRRCHLFALISILLFQTNCCYCVNGFIISFASSSTANVQRHGITDTTDDNDSFYYSHSSSASLLLLRGWVQDDQGEWEWQESGQATSFSTLTAFDDEHDDDDDDDESSPSSSATPRLPSGAFRPKQSLGQNYLKDPNTVRKILKAFAQDHSRLSAVNKKEGNNNDSKDDNNEKPRLTRILELGPGAGALTNPLVEQYGTDLLQCIEVDGRSVELLQERYNGALVVHHADVLQVNYAQMYQENEQQQLVIIGNLPYYITSQILFALADASHVGAIHSATVTMQWEVAQRMVAPTHCKDYGILSVVFQTYADVQLHFKIPPTVFYPQPKVDSALVGLHFVPPPVLAQRLAGVSPVHLRTVVTTAFQQRRKTIRNSLKKLLHSVNEAAEWNDDAKSMPPPPLPESIQRLQQQGDAFAQKQQLCQGWASKRPEELTPGQFIELTRLIYGSGSHNHEEEEDDDDESPVTEMDSSSSTPVLPSKVWRKVKHGV